jgi:hypothetical protein
MTITSRTTHSHRSRLRRLAMLLAAAVAACGIAGCNQGAVGQICHQAGDAGNESSCNEGLTCQPPRGPASMSTNANCNGTACAHS